MDDLIKDIQEQTGLSADKVLEVVTMVTEYMRQALPEDLVEQISGYLGSAANATAEASTSARSAGTTAASGAGDLVGKATDLATSAFTVAKDTVGEFTSTDTE
ncbi:MAG: hypothetical protein ACR2N2_02980 [Acidimicrobiia bacterium]